MKWKLTGRYLFSVVTIVLIVVVANMFIIAAFILYQNDSGAGEVGSDSAEEFTRQFSQYMELEDGDPVVNTEGTEALQEYDAWLQILDSDGDVVTSYFAPDTVLDSYSPIELVHNYKYMDDEFNTYFLGAFEDYSYIVGIPYSEEARYVLMLNAGSFFEVASRAVVIMLAVNIIIAAIVGLLFSTGLTRPVNAMIDRISQLKKQNFDNVKVRRPGIFRPVFANLQEVATTLREHEEERAKLEKMREEWIGNVSHDVKTPLSSVQGYAELLMDDEVSPAERKEYAEVIRRQSVYMKDLLDDLSLTMRLRNNELPLQLTENRVEPFVKEIVIGLLNDKAFEHRFISFVGEAPGVIVRFDAHLMKRAILNFIHNALLHNEDDVEVEVTVTDRFIRISDNGKGMDDDPEQVFERYYRGTNTANTTGTGLGMAIARDIIVAHDARVELTSELGKGTTVVIWFGEGMHTT
ncbi:HAMP domain-containing histidine kinase [Paenalkalicoccus suaedae]|uniref:histidine kinase n=1 Tax=Paenalkalicoccus suaedae TaxID=2592382 RepID=A0A859FJN8_9BACI|nr:HAMP domain-containing sensor histidine kinase [Paenalkalicoccus suaedae]QKS73009.1 HAMP domain-containing histidine kinase [Paenalkalicoccus suaedae]